MKNEIKTQSKINKTDKEKLTGLQKQAMKNFKQIIKGLSFHSLKNLLTCVEQRHFLQYNQGALSPNCLMGVLIFLSLGENPEGSATEKFYNIASTISEGFGANSLPWTKMQSLINKVMKAKEQEFLQGLKALAVTA
jgi:hypothetical protein